MTYNRIAVGGDGSAAAQYALGWAVHEAAGRDGCACTGCSGVAWPARLPGWTGGR